MNHIIYLTQTQRWKGELSRVPLTKLVEKLGAKSYTFSEKQNMYLEVYFHTEEDKLKAILKFF